ncbi:DUF397 domain-containing protein [Nocardiopsis sp. NPDC006938]|uniref:DUF397 domain-containing protein n=1 Tax=Nocardiopsis sp. NPDC006938 TaxID=3364337 RepID=UPI0036B60B57
MRAEALSPAKSIELIQDLVKGHEMKEAWVWHKSSYSANGANCVEVLEGQQVTAIRDTQNRHLGHLEAQAVEWAAFLKATTA